MKSQLAIETASIAPQIKTRSLPRFLPWLLSVGAIVCLMLLIVAIHRNSPRTLISFHGYLHAAVTERFLRPGATRIPPENPFYAGQPLPYYWFFHFVAAQITRLTGWNVFFSLEAVVLAGTGLLGGACLLLGYRLFRRATAGLLMAYLVLAGTNPFGIALAGLKVLTQGTGRLKDDPGFLWNVVHPVYNLVRFNDIGALYGPLISFFLNMTSRPLALGSLMVSLLCLQWALPSSRLLPLVALALSFALTTAASPIVGLAGGGILAGVLILFAFLPLRFLNRFTGTIRGMRRSYLSALSAIAVGLLLALPTYFHLITGPTDSQPHFYLLSIEGLKHLATLTLSVSVLLLLAVIGYFKSSDENRGFFRLLMLGSLALLLGDASIQLPSLNQSNLFHAAVVFLAIPAAGSIIAPAPRFSHEDNRLHLRAAIGIVLLFLPTSVAVLSAYVGRPSLPVSFDHVLPRRQPADSALAQLYDWVQKSSPADAVFVLNPENRIATNGNVLEFPAMTGRTIFTELPGHYVVPYADAGRRLDIARRLTSGREVSSADEDYLAQLRRPIYVVATDATETETGSMERQSGPPVFHAGNIRVFKALGTGGR